jgi:hypothetical protein
MVGWYKKRGDDEAHDDCTAALIPSQFCQLIEAGEPMLKFSDDSGRQYAPAGNFDSPPATPTSGRFPEKNKTRRRCIG